MAGKYFSFQTYDKRHARDLVSRAKRLRAIYDKLAKEAALAASRTGFNDKDGSFYFQRYPKVNAIINKLIEDTLSGIQDNIEAGVDNAFQLSNAKNDALIAFLAHQHRFSEELTTAITKRNESAREALKKRTLDGMNLSERVWNLKDQLKQELELALEVGLGEGKSAQALSRDVRQYLNEPNRLFRRVRDKKTGQLRLSKAAAAYHPGQGVYRSSYRNALRMTGTETNIAYRTCDNQRWNENPMIKGYEVKLSNNHPLDDMCDDLAGVYPKSFKFVGWHPQCRCYVIPVLVDDKEFERMAELSPSEYQKYVSPNMVTKMPQGYSKWVSENRDRIIKAKSAPYFIKDNYVDGDLRKGLKSTEHTGAVLGKNIISTAIEKIKGSKIHLKDFAPVRTEAINENTHMVASTLGIDEIIPKSFMEADNGRVNPKYSYLRELLDKRNGYNYNCTFTADVLELRMRGLNIRAKSLDLTIESHRAMALKGDLAYQYIDPITKNKPDVDTISHRNYNKFVKRLDKYTEGTGHYKVAVYPEDGSNGHSFSVIRTKEGVLKLYDGQNDEVDFFNWLRKMDTKKGLQILRVDNKLINRETISDIVEIIN